MILGQKIKSKAHTDISMLRPYLLVTHCICHSRIDERQLCGLVVTLLSLLESISILPKTVGEI